MIWGVMVGGSSDKGQLLIMRQGIGEDQKDLTKVLDSDEILVAMINVDVEAVTGMKKMKGTEKLRNKESELIGLARLVDLQVGEVVQYKSRKIKKARKNPNMVKISLLLPILLRCLMWMKIKGFLKLFLIG